MTEDERFWVNDFGAYANGTVTYPEGHTASIENFVGIVDEQDGGMVAYASPEVAHKLVAILNRQEDA